MTSIRLITYVKSGNNQENYKRKMELRCKKILYKQEDDMLKMLVCHLGEDFTRISNEINFTFQYQKMTMW